jgi:hypothetical protein
VACWGKSAVAPPPVAPFRSAVGGGGDYGPGALRLIVLGCMAFSQFDNPVKEAKIYAEGKANTHQ